MQIQSGSFSDAAATRQRTEAAGVAGQGAAVQQALEAAVAPDAYGEAVIVSVSEESLASQASKAPVDQFDSQDRSAGLRERDDFITLTLYSQEYEDRKKSDFERNADIISFNSTIKINSGIVTVEKERIDFLENVEPAAPRVLTGDEARKTLRMLEAFKEGDVLMGVSETGRRSWTVDGLSYALEPDGTLTVGEAGVPTSEEDRQLWLNSARERYNTSYEGLMRAQQSLAALGYEGNEVVA